MKPFLLDFGGYLAIYFFYSAIGFVAIFIFSSIRHKSISGAIADLKKGASKTSVLLMISIGSFLIGSLIYVFLLMLLGALLWIFPAINESPIIRDVIRELFSVFPLKK